MRYDEVVIEIGKDGEPSWQPDSIEELARVIGDRAAESYIYTCERRQWYRPVEKKPPAGKFWKRGKK